jgi:D-serine dehydratase
MELHTIDTSLLDSTLKGYPYDAAPCRIADIGARGWNALRGDLPYPLALLRDDALEHNLRWMADFMSAAGVLLAPHGKTTMAPQLFQRQLDAGAWGMTLATMQQVRLCVDLGLRRIILANQLVADIDIAQAGALLARHPDLELHFLIDSLPQLAIIERVAAAHGVTRRFSALLEVGVKGGRTGCRGAGEALSLARAIAASGHVELAGVECYEGLKVTGDNAADTVLTEALMDDVQHVASLCDAEGLFAGPRVILSAGGSAVFDLVARSLPMRLSMPVQTILRSGCYLSHDSGSYERYARQVVERSGAVWQSRPPLRAALEVWTQVQSMPEAGLAILALGKRDASFDIEMPLPFARVADGVRTELDAGCRIVKLNDQHAYMMYPAGQPLRVGDLVGSGISHPCTTFDRWRWLPLVDAQYNVTGAVRTFF